MTQLIGRADDGPIQTKTCKPLHTIKLWCVRRKVFYHFILNFNTSGFLQSSQLYFPPAKVQLALGPIHQSQLFKLLKWTNHITTWNFSSTAYIIHCWNICRDWTASALLVGLLLGFTKFYYFYVNGAESQKNIRHETLLLSSYSATVLSVWPWLPL
jgi:hypothetical protein